MTPDDYKSWEDLLGEELEESVSSTDPIAVEDQNSERGAIPLPEEYNRLLAEKEQLEQQLKKLTGQAPPDPEEERRKVLYPVKVHTKESRIEERRLRKKAEQEQWLKQKALEQKIAQKKSELKRFRQREEAMQLLKRRQLTHQAWENKKKRKTRERQILAKQKLIQLQKLDEKTQKALAEKQKKQLQERKIAEGQEEQAVLDRQQRITQTLQQKALARKKEAQEQLFNSIPKKGPDNKPKSRRKETLISKTATNQNQRKTVKKKKGLALEKERQIEPQETPRSQQLEVKEDEIQKEIKKKQKLEQELRAQAELRKLEAIRAKRKEQILEEARRTQLREQRIQALRAQRKLEERAASLLQQKRDKRRVEKKAVERFSMSKIKKSKKQNLF